MLNPVQRLWMIVLVMAVGFTGVAARAESTAEAFESFADRFKFLGIHELLYDRSEIYLADPKAMEAYLPLLAEFRARQDTVEELLPLLRHSDARVRLLAIMALDMKGDAHVLPAIAGLMNDEATTYLDPPVDKQRARLSGIGPSHEPKTVGAAAEAVVAFHMRAAGNSYPRQFETYWAARKGRKYCASWFGVQMIRASQGISPVPAGYADRVRQIRRQIDEVPADDRRWILLQLAAQFGPTHLVTPEELRDLCRGIGSETLRKMINSRAGAGATAKDAFVPPDPDVHPDSLRWFIFDHAPDLLTSADADAVLAAGNVIAAADLRPAMAAEWLKDSLEERKGAFRGWDRAKLIAAMWRICGPAEMDAVVNWYYSDPPDPGSFPTARSMFLEDAKSHPRAEFRDLIAGIISDPRLLTTGPDSTRTLIQIVNAWLPNPLASDAEIRDSYGRDELDSRQADKFKPLADWHLKLQASVAEWAPRPAPAASAHIPATSQPAR